MVRRVLFVAWAPFFSGAERALLLTLRSLDPGRYVPVVLSLQHLYDSVCSSGIVGFQASAHELQQR
jgi:hypothetical protein